MCCELRRAHVTIFRLHPTKYDSIAFRTTKYYSGTAPHYKVVFGTTKYYSGQDEKHILRRRGCGREGKIQEHPRRQEG